MLVYKFSLHTPARPRRYSGLFVSFWFGNGWRGIVHGGKFTHLTGTIPARLRLVTIDCLTGAQAVALTLTLYDKCDSLYTDTQSKSAKSNCTRYGTTAK